MKTEQKAEIMSEIKALIGIILLLSPFVGIFIVGGNMLGWRDVIICFLIAIGIIVTFALGLYFLLSD